MASKNNGAFESLHYNLIYMISLHPVDKSAKGNQPEWFCQAILQIHSLRVCALSTLHAHAPAPPLSLSRFGDASVFRRLSPTRLLGLIEYWQPSRNCRQLLILKRNRFPIYSFDQASHATEP
jgi:hypothetical protein